MPDSTSPKSDRIGGDYKQGSNPSPGGTVDVENVPPDEGRTTARGQSKHGGAESVERQMAETHGPGTGATTTPMEESPVQEHEVTNKAPESPHGVGESTSRRGEDIVKEDGKERGRSDGPREHPSDRPTGYSDEHDTTSIG
jgi:hypothetical protein